MSLHLWVFGHAGGGIVAKKPILLLDADQKFRIGGVAALNAMIQPGERSQPPIAMKALATIAGMIPPSLVLGAGSEVLQPLAIAVIEGEILDPWCYR